MKQDQFFREENKQLIVKNFPNTFRKKKLMFQNHFFNESVIYSARKLYFISFSFFFLSTVFRVFLLLRIFMKVQLEKTNSGFVTWSYQNDVKFVHSINKVNSGGWNEVKSLHSRTGCKLKSKETNFMNENVGISRMWKEFNLKRS